MARSFKAQGMPRAHRPKRTEPSDARVRATEPRKQAAPQPGSPRGPNHSAPPSLRSPPTHPARLWPLLLPLVAQALVGPGADAQACPERAPWFRSGKLDLSRYTLFFTPGPTFQVVTASDARTCKTLTNAYGCANKLTSAFFVYSTAGFVGNKAAKLGNCAIGPGCRALARGNTVALFGRVIPVICPKAPPPPVPTPPPTPAAPFVQCPNATLPSVSASVSPANIFQYLGTSVDMVDATNAADCQAQAKQAKCAGSLAAFVLFAQAGFTDPVLGSIGNCVFGDGCIQIPSGSTAATLSILPSTCSVKK